MSDYESNPQDIFGQAIEIVSPEERQLFLDRERAKAIELSWQPWVRLGAVT